MKIEERLAVLKIAAVMAGVSQTMVTAIVSLITIRVKSARTGRGKTAAWNRGLDAFERHINRTKGHR